MYSHIIPCMQEVHKYKKVQVEQIKT